MIESKLDYSKPLSFVRYGRMSSDLQNPRSPDQQFDEIQRTIDRQGHTQWRHVADFRDDGVSGRYIKKRPEFSRMLGNIRTGRLQVDLILVDTLERFGRFDELNQVRDELRKRHGVLILTADSRFDDPTSVVGQVYGTIEAIRARTDNSKKAHDVLRGKIDAARQRHWPGGAAPCGYRLELRTQLLPRRNGRPVESAYRVLIPDESTADIPRRMFALAHGRGWGSVRIAKELNADQEFVERHGMANASKVFFILTNPIYKGTLRFNVVATDVIDDRRVIRKRDESEVVYVEEFCEPLVSAEVFDYVESAIKRRGERQRAARLEANGKVVQPLAPGLSLAFPLTGLVRCASCGAAMRATRSGAVSQDSACYYYYRCPIAIDDRCGNRIYLRGPWLWKVVIAHIREKLFPLPQPSDTSTVPTWLVELVGEARRELRKQIDDDRDRLPVLQRELADLRSQVDSLTESLTKTGLASAVREQLEGRLNTALVRQCDIKDELQLLASQSQHVDALLDVQGAISRLQRLDDLLLAGNPSDLNTELALHIEAILVSPDGTVELRTHRLGLFEGVPQLLTREVAGQITTTNDGIKGHRVKPRALARRRTSFVEASTSPLTTSPGTIDSNISLPEKWIDTAIFIHPKRTCWSREHAQEVATFRRENTRATLAEIAAHFERSLPTIRSALEYAAVGDSDPVLRRKRNWNPPAVRDAREIADIAGHLYDDERLPIKSIASQLDVNRNTVSRALDFYYEKRGKTRPDGRGQRKNRKK